MVFKALNNLAPCYLPILHVFGTLRVRLCHKGLSKYISSLFTKNKLFEKKALTVKVQLAGMA